MTLLYALRARLPIAVISQITACVIPLGCAALLAACSSGDGAAPAAPADAGAPDTSDASLAVISDASGEAAHIDAGHQDSGGDASITPPVGSHLATGDNLQIQGMTGDGYAVYADFGSNELYAVPINGGAPVTIASIAGGSDAVLVQASVVLAWTQLDANSVGTLTAWSAATGAHVLSTASTPGSSYWVGAASPDSSRVAYAGNVTSTTADVYASATDGTGATKLVAAAPVGTCLPFLVFAGAHLLAATCPTSTGYAVSSFSVPAWSRADLASDLTTFDWDHAGTTLIAFPATAGVQAIPIGGGPATTIDTVGAYGSVTPDGKSVVYSTVTEIKRSPIASPLPITLVSSQDTPGVRGIYGVAPSGETLLFYTQATSSAIVPSTDLFLASAVTPGVPAGIVSGGSPTVDGYQVRFADDSTPLFLQYYAPASGGNLEAVPGGADAGAPIMLAQSVSVYRAVPQGRVVFETASTPPASGSEIEVVNLSGATPPVPFVGDADIVFELSPTRDRVVYTWSAEKGALAGLYVVAVP